MAESLRASRDPSAALGMTCAGLVILPVSQIFDAAVQPPYAGDVEFVGRHYETGTIANAMAVAGAGVSEALALGASGGIAFGYFVFEYTGQLPHVALLPRNTFSPFERALDNLGIRREVRETTNPTKGEENLRRALDGGSPTLVWADMFSLPWSATPDCGMWFMRPLLVVGSTADGFMVVDRPGHPREISAEALAAARGKVKKERYRVMELGQPDVELMKERLPSAIETCVALFLDRPPAGAVTNFGIAGMRHFSKMVADENSVKGWGRTFPPGPRLSQALAGRPGQPGVWNWIETWGTAPGADRGTYAAFLREAAEILGQPELNEIAMEFLRSGELWKGLAETALPDRVPGVSNLRALYRGAGDAASIRELLAEIEEPLGQAGPAIREEMALRALEIADLEERAARKLRELGRS